MGTAFAGGGTAALAHFFLSSQVQWKRQPQATLDRYLPMTALATSTAAAAPTIVEVTTTLRSSAMLTVASGWSGKVRLGLWRGLVSGGR